MIFKVGHVRSCHLLISLSHPEENISFLKFITQNMACNLEVMGSRPTGKNIFSTLQKFTFHVITFINKISKLLYQESEKMIWKESHSGSLAIRTLGILLEGHSFEFHCMSVIFQFQIKLIQEQFLSNSNWCYPCMVGISFVKKLQRKYLPMSLPIAPTL